MGNVARIEKEKNVCRVVVGKPETKRPLERCSSGWEDNNKLDLKHVEWGRKLDLSGSAQASIAGCSEHDKTPSTSIKFEYLPDLLRNYQLPRKHIR